MPLTADLFADADLALRAQVARIEEYPSGLLQWLGTTPRATPWIYTGALENHPDLVDEMAAVRPLLGCPGRVVRQVRDPLRLARLLAEARVAFPETAIASAASPQQARGGWLLKSCRGSSGAGVRAQAREPYPGAHGPLYLQRRVDGPSGAALFIAAGGTARLLGVTRQLVGTTWAHAAPFQYVGSIGPWNLDDPAREALQRAATVIAGLGVVGLCGIDFVCSQADGQAYVIEVNPRYTASVEVVERMTGEAALGEHVLATCDHRFLSPAAKGLARPGGIRSVAPGPPFFGKAILFAHGTIHVDPAFADWALDRAGVADFPLLADLPPAGTEISTGRPVLTVFAEGESHAGVEIRLRHAVEDVERRLLNGG